MDKLKCLSVRKLHNNVNVTEITFEVPHDRESRFEIFLSSDEHYDSKDCDRRLLKEHWDLAVERGQYILSFGDFFDLMGGKFDKRTGKGSLREQHSYGSVERGFNYITAVMDEGYEFLREYKDNLLFLTKGNHEDSVQRIHEITVTHKMVEQLRNEGAKTEYGPYRGFLRLKFVAKGNPNKAIAVQDVYYSHGSGGNSPVTKGTIQTARMSDYIEADIYVVGHIHNEWQLTQNVASLTTQGHMLAKRRLFLQVGTYKRFNMSDSWAAMKGMGPPAIGGTILQFDIKRVNNLRTVSTAAIRSHYHDSMRVIKRK